MFRLLGENVGLLSRKRFIRRIYALLLLVTFSVFIIPLAADDTHPEQKATTPPNGHDNAEQSAKDNTQPPSEDHISGGKDEAQMNAVNLCILCIIQYKTACIYNAP